jgi:hypothetical protein
MESPPGTPALVTGVVLVRLSLTGAPDGTGRTEGETSRGWRDASAMRPNDWFTVAAMCSATSPVFLTGKRACLSCR